MMKEARRALAVGRYNNLGDRLEVKVGEEPVLVVTREEALELGRMLIEMGSAPPPSVDGY